MTSLRGKILLLSSVTLVLLLAAAGWLVQEFAVRAAREGMADEVRASLRSYESLWRSRVDMLAAVSRVMSNMSDVRAAFSTGDRATIQDTAGELWSNISPDTRGEEALFLVADPQGQLVASLSGPATMPTQPIVRASVARFPGQAVGFLRHESRLYQVVVTPVYVEAQTGAALLNVLIAGYPVNAAVVQRLKESTGGSDFLFALNGKVVASTLDPATTATLQATAMPVSELLIERAGGADFAVLATPLLDLQQQPIGELRIIRPFSQVARRIAMLERELVLIWLVAAGIGLFLSYLLARSLVRPIKRLEQAAAEVSRQNYDRRVPVESQDELGRLAATFNDMCGSLQEAREELIRRERIATIGHLSTSIVHDLRNPLAAIYGGAEMMVDGDLPPAQLKRLANNIYRASRRIQEMLQDLTNFSRGRAESAELCRLRDLIAAAAEPLLATADSQRVQMSIEVAPEIELSLERARIERVFFNLFSNALEAMPEGGSLRVEAERKRDHVLVRVQDSGPGISEEIRSRLFQPFTTAGKKNGLGLGLALSRQTVLAHGGELWAESTGPGACFCLRLPAA